MSHTHKQLLMVLLSSVSNADYLTAENIARKEEADFGTLTDLRQRRDTLLRDLADLAEQIDKLDEEVQGINCSRRARATMPDHLGFPSIRMQSAHSHLIQRFPCCDEQQAA